MIASIAQGDSRIQNYSTGADCHSTLDCMRALGIAIEEHGTEVLIHGRGLDGLRAPTAGLDAGNSGSTIRMLAGILAAQPFSTHIGGDDPSRGDPWPASSSRFPGWALPSRRATAAFRRFEIDGGHSAAHRLSAARALGPGENRVCCWPVYLRKARLSYVRPCAPRPH